MQTYERLHQLFPSKKLIRRLLKLAATTNTTNIVDVQQDIQAALLTVLKHGSLNETVYLTQRGKCILHPFLDDAGKVRQIVFESDARKRYVTRKLAKQLRLLAKDGIDVEGQGLIVVQNGDVVYVPNPIVPKYGNILLFVPGIRY